MSASAEGNETDPNLTPLLDVVLQADHVLHDHRELRRVEHLTDKVVLPVAQSAIPQDDSGEDWVYLNVGKDGKLLVSNEDLSTPAKLRIFLLKRKEEIENLAAFRGVKPESLRITVIISAHEEARAGKVWEILDSCEKAGFKRWKVRALTREPPKK